MQVYFRIIITDVQIKRKIEGVESFKMCAHHFYRVRTILVMLNRSGSICIQDERAMMYRNRLATKQTN